MVCEVSNDVFKDTQIDKWMEKQVILDGSREIIKNIIYNPTNELETLLKRQKLLRNFIYDLKYQLAYIKQTENAIIKTIEMDSLYKNKDNDDSEMMMMSMLFPNDFYNSWISDVSHFLELYHGYRIYSLPLLQIISPIGIVLTPYLYATRNLGLNITLGDYLQFLWKMIKMSVEYGGDFKTMMIRWITLLVYISVYAYNIWQTCDSAISLHNHRQVILERMNNVKAYLDISRSIFEMVGEGVIETISSTFNISLPDTTFAIDGSLTDAYCFWTNSESYRFRIERSIQMIYYIDVINTVSNLLHNPHWCIVEYTTQNVGAIAKDARNPILNNDQQPNNIDLNKNIIVTGPNAGGKTTYVKTLVANVLLAQTFGIAMSSHMSMSIFDIISTFMRITDVVGSLSYFEAETKYCKDMIDKAINSPTANILFVMDEPMHSTPPTEGQSTAYAVCEYIANRFSRARLIITTHFHMMVKLEERYPTLFKNISMDALEKQDGSFLFPYKIREGYSFQCIAIELLGNKMFPKELIKSAIEQKKLCEKSV